jgi:hypothetical protein
MLPVKTVCVDFQKDFSSPSGIGYRPRPCIDFIKGELVPYFGNMIGRSQKSSRITACPVLVMNSNAVCLVRRDMSRKFPRRSNMT